jgi:hypothetical protein
VKEKFSANRGEALINQRGWLLSHTVRRSTAKNRQNRIGTAPNPIVARCFCAPTSNPARFYLSVHRRFFFRETATPGEQNESERRPRRLSRQARAASLELRAQVAAGFAGFFGLRGLALTGFREDAGLMLSGRPAATGVTSGAGSLKNTRQPGDSCDLLRIMQAVTRSTSGISGPQSRKASPLQACSSSWV